VFESIASFDIGSSRVKLALAKKSFKTFNITEVISEDIDFSLPSYSEGLTAAIKKIIDRQPIGGHKVIINFPIEQTIVRSLTFPFTDPEQIEAAVPFEAQENIPFDMDELALSFQNITEDQDEKGRVIASAVRKDSIERFNTLLADAGASPSFVGSEINALYECYMNFAAVEDEKTIVIHIGHTKTIVIFISNGTLSHARCIPSGTQAIIKQMIGSSITINDALRLFSRLKPGVAGIDAKTDISKFKKDGITKPKLKSIFDTAANEMNSLCSQINLTIRAYSAETGSAEFDRIILSGGGSSIAGLAGLIHSETGIKTDKADFELAVGTAISYFNAGSDRIHFPTPTSATGDSGNILKKYRLAMFFGGAGIIMLIVNIIIGLFFSALEKSNYDEIISGLFKKNFQSRNIEGNPIAEAEKIVDSERKDLQSILSVIPSDDPLIGYLSDVTSQFSSDPTFNLRNMVIDREFIRFDGDIGSGVAIDAFTKKIQESKKFESVTPNTSMSRKDLISFSIVIKLKKSTTGAAK
jgi:type IV pilus assembly protein PilM